MAMIGKVKRMYFRQKKSVREIVRLTSLSRNTVRKWLKAFVLDEPRYRRSPAPGKLSAFHDAIKLALKADAHRPRHERRTARALHAQIRDTPAATAASPTSCVGGARVRASRSPRRPSCPWPSSSGRRSSSTGAKRAWWSAASTTACRSRT